MAVWGLNLLESQGSFLAKKKMLMMRMKKRERAWLWRGVFMKGFSKK